MAGIRGGFRNPLLTGVEIPDGTITTPMIANLAITNAKIANAAVDTAQIALAAITTALIDNLAVTNAKIANATIASAKIQDLTALLFRTATSGERLVIDGTTGEAFVRMYNTGGTEVGRMGYDATGFGTNILGIANTSGVGGITLDADGELVLKAGGSAGAGVSVRSDAAGGVPGTLFQVQNSAGTATYFTVKDNNVVSANTFSGNLAAGATGSGGITKTSDGFVTIFDRGDGFFAFFMKGHPTTSSGANMNLGGDDRVRKSTSSRDYKTAIRPFDGRHSVLDLTPSLYRSTSDGDDSRKVRLGLIAEDVAERFPMGFAAPDGVDWNPIIAGTIHELQDLVSRVERLESRVYG